MLSMQLQLIFMVFLLKILASLLCAGKCLSTRLRNFLPMLVFMFPLNGGVEPKDVTRSFLCSVDAGWGSSGKHSIFGLEAAEFQCVVVSWGGAFEGRLVGRKS